MIGPWAKPFTQSTTFLRTIFFGESNGSVCPFKGSTAIRGHLTAKSKLRSLNILLVTDSVIRIINRFTSVANSDV